MVSTKADNRRKARMAKIRTAANQLANAATELAERIIGAIDYKDAEHSNSSTEKSSRSEEHTVTPSEARIDGLLEFIVSATHAWKEPI
ncbi:uncharacterized protein PFLUO_LOCUS2332 [Penicillium psychrofluorescens]|uniref:uncharacterized protein n=1 Tax=Penicillium psychrofluorescens TaxID=3158075 RepID=UPI003CCD342F